MKLPISVYFLYTLTCCVLFCYIAPVTSEHRNNFNETENTARKVRALLEGKSDEAQLEDGFIIKVEDSNGMYSNHAMFDEQEEEYEENYDEQEDNDVDIDKYSFLSTYEDDINLKQQAGQNDRELGKFRANSPQIVTREQNELEEHDNNMSNTNEFFYIIDEDSIQAIAKAFVLKHNFPSSNEKMFRESLREIIQSLNHN